MSNEPVVPIRAEEFEGRKRTVRYRDVKVQKMPGFNGGPESDAVCIYKDVINPDSKEVLYHMEHPDIFRVGGKDGHKQLRNSLWGMFISEWLPTVKIAESDDVGLVLTKSPTELIDCVFVEEQKLIQIGKLEPKNRWVPVLYLGKGKELGIQ